MIVLADDFTGANDTGVAFAKKGARTFISLGEGEEASKTEVLVKDTKSRALPKEEAERAVKDALAGFCGQIVYKKIDSTFRGNVGAEIEAAMKASKKNLAILAPALPAAGRTCKEGLVYVHGVELVKTEFASDVKAAISSSSAKELIARTSFIKTQNLSLKELRQGALPKIAKAIKDEKLLLIVDGENDSDLALVADFIKDEVQRVGKGKLPLLCGSAGFANALDASLYLKARSSLCVVGSLSAISRAQVLKAAQREGVELISSSAKELLEESQKIEKAAKDALNQGKCVIIYSSKSEDDRARVSQLAKELGLSQAELANLISLKLGELSKELISSFRVQDLYLSGGDTAIAVASALGAGVFEVKGELAPCTPWGYFKGFEDMRVVTKAGGFGDEDTLCQVLEKLKAIV